MAQQAVSSVTTSALDNKVRATVEQLRQAVRDYGKVVYSNSLGAESMVLTDLIWSHVPSIDIFSIDTGRLHEETYSLLERLERRYQRRIRLVYPNPEALESYTSENGINGFYNSVEQRQSCCHIRKVEPFRRAIAGSGAWVTGVRKEQSATRAQAKAGRVRRAERPVQDQPDPRLDARRHLGVHPRAQAAVQHAPRSGLPEHRLRAVHARGGAGRRQPLGPLVVGEFGRQGVRSASAHPRRSVAKPSPGLRPLPPQRRAASRRARDARAAWTTCRSSSMSVTG